MPEIEKKIVDGMIMWMRRMCCVPNAIVLVTPAEWYDFCRIGSSDIGKVLVIANTAFRKQLSLRNGWSHRASIKETIDWVKDSIEKYSITAPVALFIDGKLERFWNYDGGSAKEFFDASEYFATFAKNTNP
jgi:hypothetical protein